MLTVETIRKVKLAHYRHEKSIRQISKDMRLSRNTVRKLLRSDEHIFDYKRILQPMPKLGLYGAWLDEQLEYDSQQPRKHRRTAKVLFELLQGRGYDGGYDAVRRYVSRWRIKHGKGPSRAFVPLAFAPGEAYQFDWSHEQLEIGGMPMIVKLAHFRLCHSRMVFCVAYSREKQEMLFDAHDRGFSFFGGSCARGIYDNMKTAVSKVLRGKRRELNPRFEQMCIHYLIEPVLCTPGAGWEKGQVENQVHFVRTRFLAGRRSFASLDDLNEWFLERSIGWAKVQKHPECSEKTIWEVFQEEREVLYKPSGPFDGYRLVTGNVSSTCLVRFDRNRYSVPCEWAEKTVQVKGYADRVVIVQDGHVLAEHVRRFCRDKPVYEPWHYVPLLERKPGALRNGAPFQNWKLPPSIEQIRLALQRFEDWDRQFVGILTVVPHHGLQAVSEACGKALSQGTVSKDAVLNILSRSLDQEPVKDVQVSDHLKITCEPSSNCGRYDQLLGVVDAAQ